MKIRNHSTTRERRFNRKFGDVFTVPDPVIRQVGARIMGLNVRQDVQVGRREISRY